MPERLVATSTQFWPVDEQPLAALLSQGKKYLLDTVLRVSLEAGFRYPRGTTPQEGSGCRGDNLAWQQARRHPHGGIQALRHALGHPQRHQLTAFRCQEATDHRKEIWQRSHNQTQAADHARQAS